MPIIAEVKSSKSNIIYDVKLWPNKKATCTCPGFAFRKNCKHINKVKEIYSSKTSDRKKMQEWVDFGGVDWKNVEYLPEPDPADNALSEFYGRGESTDPDRERYVSQQKVSKGELPSGRRATQEGVDGYIVDKYVYQDPVKKGLTPSGKEANQPAVEGYLTQNPQPHLKGLSKPEIMQLYFSGNLKKASAPSIIKAPKLPKSPKRKAPKPRKTTTKQTRRPKRN